MGVRGDRNLGWIREPNPVLGEGRVRGDFGGGFQRVKQRASIHRLSLVSSEARLFSFFSSVVTVASEGQREEDGFRPANGLPPGNPSYLYSMSDWTIGTLEKRIGPKAFGIGEGRTSPWGPREQMAD